MRGLCIEQPVEDKKKACTKAGLKNIISQTRYSLPTSYRMPI